MTTALDEERLEERLNDTFAALANPVRRAILARLARGEASVSELAEPFEMSMPAISRHIRVLEHAGLVRQGRRAQYRPCTLDVAPLRDVAAWADHYREVWETSFDRMNDYLHDLQDSPTETQDETQENSDDGQP